MSNDEDIAPPCIPRHWGPICVWPGCNVRLMIGESVARCRMCAVVAHLLQHRRSVLVAVRRRQSAEN